MRFLRLRNSTHLGIRPLPNLVTGHLSHLSLLGWQNSTHITSEAQSQMHTLWQWVCIVSLFLIYIGLTAHCAIVLDPSKKMSYFCKHWPPELVSDVEDTIQTTVSSFTYCS